MGINQNPKFSRFKKWAPNKKKGLKFSLKMKNHGNQCKLATFSGTEMAQLEQIQSNQSGER